METKEYGHGTLADGVRILARQELVKTIDRVLNRIEHEVYEESWGKERTLWDDVKESPIALLELLKEELERG